MKVEIKSKSNTISNSDIHSNVKSLTEMIRRNSKNIYNPNPINKEDNYQKLFNRSISKTLKERQHHYL